MNLKGLIEASAEKTKAMEALFQGADSQKRALSKEEKGSFESLEQKRLARLVKVLNKPYEMRVQNVMNRANPYKCQSGGRFSFKPGETVNTSSVNQQNLPMYDDNGIMKAKNNSY